MRCIKVSFILVTTLLLSNCYYMDHDFSLTKPFTLTMKPPPGPYEYQQGFKDGCESGYSGYANSFNKMFWDWKQDPELAQDETYYKMWKDAYAYCAVYAMAAGVHGWGNAR